MEPQLLKTLTDRLLAKSEARQINWEVYGKNQYGVEMSKSVVTIAKSTDTTGRTRYGLDVYNDAKEVVESAMVSVSSEELWRKLARVYDLARRISLKSDETIDQLLEELS
ncbi:MAG TPA: hypothetical protein PKA82_10535 [Pyrinomonadaceae bacterium]|nr:hypothetical protein [Pyrinomonadaceae bacterium]